MSGMAGEILVFEAGGRTFGLGIGEIERVVHAVRPLPLPHAPAFIAGLLNLHGTAIPVLDLNAWFGDPPREVGIDDLLIVLRTGAARVALHVERARGVATIAPSSIQPPGSVLAHPHHFSGVAMINDEIVLLPDVASFVAAVREIDIPRKATAA